MNRKLSQPLAALLFLATGGFALAQPISPQDPKPNAPPSAAPSDRPPATPPVQPAQPAQSPATTPPASTDGKPSSGDRNVDALLDRLEAKGDAVKGISARLVYNDIRIDPVEEKVIKRGELFFRRLEPNSKFLIVFNETLAGGVRSANKEYYLFDGAWFTERVDRTKSIIKRQIVRSGERIDPFKIGQGPFPLPFGQKRADIVQNFDVTWIKPAKDDPPASDHLYCVPRPTSDLSRQWKKLDMYVDQKLGMPIRIVVERVADDTVLDVSFLDLNPYEAPAASRFDIERTPPGFDVREEPLPDRPSEPPPRGRR